MKITASARRFLRGIVRTRTLLFCISVTLALSLLLFHHTQKDLKAAGQAVLPQEIWKIENSFLAPLLRVDGLATTAAETAELASIFSDSEAALSAGWPAAQNKELFRHEIRTAQLQELERFAADNPASAWTPSLRVNLGSYYQGRKQFTPALQHYADTWEQLQLVPDGNGKHIADLAIAYLTRLLMVLGRTEELNVIYAQHGNRILDGGSLSQFWLRTHEKHLRMQKYVQQSYKCGVYALDRIAARFLGTATYEQAALLRTPSSPAGFSLWQLSQLGNTIGLQLTPVVRENSGDLVIPSVLHYRQNHYAAILDEKNGLFYVVDPSAGDPAWLTAAEINAEASGFFLVPVAEVRAPFRPLDAVAAGQIFGQSSACPPDDWEDDHCPGSGSDPNCPTCGGGGPSGGGFGGGVGGSSNDAEKASSQGGGCDICELNKRNGMISWTVSEPYVNLWFQDIPLSYQPSKGPSVEMKLSFKTRKEDNASYVASPLGPGWSLSWIEAVLGSKVYSGTGGSETFDLVTSNPSALGYRSNRRLEQHFDGGGFTTGFTLYYGDGSKSIFGYQGRYSWYITEKWDPSGNKVTFAYSNEKLTSIADADGGTVSFYYEDLDYPDLITKVQAPGSREVLLDYDTIGRLTSLTDTEGIVSSLAYDVNGWPTSITTPYGTTSFNIAGTGIELDRSIIITHPDSTMEAYSLIDVYSETNFPNTFETAQLPTGTPFATNSYPYGTIETANRRERNTFYWNRQQFGSLGSTNLASFTWSEFKRGRIRHWLWKSSDPSYTHVDTLNHEQAPSPDGSTEGVVTFFDYDGKSYLSPEIRGTQILPAVVARVQPDGTTWYKRSYFNSLGKTAGELEKWTNVGAGYTRTWTNIFATNNIDLVESRGPGGHLIAGYSYGGSHPHLPATMTNALGEVTTYTYESGTHRLSTVTTPSGLLSTYTYPATNAYYSKIVDSVSGTPLRTNSFTWSNGLIATHTTELGLSITNTWDKLNRLKKITYPDATAIEYFYTNGVGSNIVDLGAIKDRLGNWTYYTYNSLRQKTFVRDSLGRDTKYDYCDCGSPSHIHQAYGTSLALVTTNYFDYQGHITETHRPGGLITTNKYDLLGRLTNVLDALGSTTNWYDNLGRLVTVSNALGQVQKLVYDSEDNVTSSIDANGVTTTFTYDDLHRLKTRALSGGGTESYGYTLNTTAGPTSHTNELGKITQYAYHAAGWKTNEVYVNMATNKFTYDQSGSLRTLTDGKNQVTKWGYDAYGRVTSKTNHNNLEILRYKYDASSRLTNRWSNAKANTYYAYDPVGNLTNINYFSGTDSRYKYDALNRLTNMVDAAGTTVYTYDMANRFIVEDGPWASDNITNRWNTAGARSALAIQQPTSYFNNAYSYDAARRLTSVASGAGTYSYYYHPGLNSVTAPTRLVHRLSLPNTSYITNFYDSLARLTDTSLKQSGGTITNRHAYVYNNGHQRTKQTRTDGGYVDYLYDDVAQLYSAKTYTSGGGAVNAENRGYKYDPAWNLNQRTNNATVATFTVDALNQLSAFAGGTNTYDGNGNLIGEGGSGRLSFYDDENQLVASEIPIYWRVEFTYDGKMRLRKKIDYTWDGSSWVWSAETRYVYDGMLVVQERNSGNTPTVTYTRGVDLSGSLQGAGGIGGLLGRSHGYSSGTWSTHNHYHADGNGNVTFLINSSQSISASYKYDPFGNTISSSGTLGTANTYRFSSKMFDPTASLYYYGYRFYDPNLQRWLNRDPLEERGGANLFAFVDNQPISGVDTLGLKPGIIIGPPVVKLPAPLQLQCVVWAFGKCVEWYPMPPPDPLPLPKHKQRFRPPQPISCNAPVPRPTFPPVAPSNLALEPFDPGNEEHQRKYQDCINTANRVLGPLGPEPSQEQLAAHRKFLRDCMKNQGISLPGQ